MPWYWTDDLARTLLDAGKVHPMQVASWLSAPVAIRRGEQDSEVVAASLLDGDVEDAEPPPTAGATLYLAA
jgi:hypothetical protein